LFISAPATEFVALVLAIEADRWQTTEIDAWLRRHTKTLC
jgi:hypothetical protein